MLGYLPEKDLIFFIPGKTGSVFALPAKKQVTVRQLLETQEFLVCETKNSVVYIEDRRIKPRSSINGESIKGFAD